MDADIHVIRLRLLSIHGLLRVFVAVSAAAVPVISSATAIPVGLARGMSSSILTCIATTLTFILNIMVQMAHFPANVLPRLPVLPPSHLQLLHLRLLGGVADLPLPLPGCSSLMVCPLTALGIVPNLGINLLSPLSPTILVPLKTYAQCLSLQRMNCPISIFQLASNFSYDFEFDKL